MYVWWVQEDESVRLIGVEASGHGVETDKHAATLTKGTPGVLHGSFSFLLQDAEGQVIDPHSISAGYAATLSLMRTQTWLLAAVHHLCFILFEMCCNQPGFHLSVLFIVSSVRYWQSAAGFIQVSVECIVHRLFCRLSW